jgi:predicted deacylase
MVSLGMLEPGAETPGVTPLLSRSTKWTRAPRGGIVRLQTSLGAEVKKGEPVGLITDPTARDEVEVKSRATGIVIGQTVNPLVSMGDALVHVAEIESTSEVDR